MHTHEMSEEKKAKMTEHLKELGVDEAMIDEKLMWSVKKTSHGLTKLRIVLEDKGIDESKANEVIDKLVEKAKTKDLAKVRAWMEEHQEHKHQS